VIDQSANSIGNRLMFSLIGAPPSRSVEGYASGTDVSVASAEWGRGSANPQS